MKLKSVRTMIKENLENGTIQKGDTLVETSSGLYAECLAMTCKEFNLECIIVTFDGAIDPWLQKKLQLLGATLEILPDYGLDQNQGGRIKKIEELMKNNPKIKWLQQYHNEEHYIGYYDIGKLLKDTLMSDIILVGTVGSGCSTGGIFTEYTKTYKNSKLVGIQPFGSVSFGYNDVASERIVGIGAGVEMRNIHHHLYDDIHWVTYDIASLSMKELYQEYQLSLGLTGALSYYIAKWYTDKTNKPIIFLAPTSEARYEKNFLHDVVAPNFIEPKIVTNVQDLAKPWSIMHFKRDTV